MPKYTSNEKAGMLSRASEADKKAGRYASEARVYGAAASRGKGPVGLDYTVGRDAARKQANMYEEEAEMLRQRAMPAPNSRAQYDSEKEAGDPNALNMSFEQWKKL